MTETEMKDRSEMSKKIEQLTAELYLQERAFLDLWNEFCELNREFVSLEKEKKMLAKELEEECDHGVNAWFKVNEFQRKLYKDDLPFWKRGIHALARRVLGFL